MYCILCYIIISTVKQRMQMCCSNIWCSCIVYCIDINISAVKQRMQMCCSKYTRWTLCAKSIYRKTIDNHQLRRKMNTIFILKQNYIPQDYFKPNHEQWLNKAYTVHLIYIFIIIDLKYFLTCFFISYKEISPQKKLHFSVID